MVVTKIPALGYDLTCKRGNATSWESAIGEPGVALLCKDSSRPKVTTKFYKAPSSVKLDNETASISYSANGPITFSTPSKRVTLTKGAPAAYQIQFPSQESVNCIGSLALLK